MKIEATDTNKILTDYILASRIHKEISKLNYEKNDPVLKWARDLNKRFAKVHQWVATGHVK